MKALYVVAALVLFAMASLQFNDPDPIYWVFVYAGAALVVLRNGFVSVTSFWTALMLGAVVAGMLEALPGFYDYLRSGNPGSIFSGMLELDYVEPAREFLGLAIAGAILLACLRHARRQ